MAILRLLLGNPGTKNHSDVGAAERHREYYMGEGGGLPRIQAVVSLIVQSRSWLVLAPKVLQIVF